MPSRPEAVWISVAAAIAIHGMQVAEHGGASGLRDRGLLESAVLRPQQIYAYESDCDLQRLSAAYICGLIRNHPFLDGNKRVGLVLGALFLRRNGKRLTAPQPETANVILELAAGSWTEERLTAWLRHWT